MDKLEVISYDKVGLTGESLSVQLSLEHFTYSLPGVFLSYTLPSTPSFFSSNFQSLAYLTSTRRHLENTLKRTSAISLALEIVHIKLASVIVFRSQDTQ